MGPHRDSFGERRPFPSKLQRRVDVLVLRRQNAYNQGNYVDAEQYLSRALQLIRPRSEDPKREIYVGRQRLQEPEHSIAKVNLSLYRDNPIAVDLLNKISDIEGKWAPVFITSLRFKTLRGSRTTPSTRVRRIARVKRACRSR